MTHDQVNAWEDKLRKAQELVEEAGRDICGIRGVGDVWNMCNTTSQLISQIIGQQHRLRPSRNEILAMVPTEDKDDGSDS